VKKEKNNEKTENLDSENLDRKPLE